MHEAKGLIKGPEMENIEKFLYSEVTVCPIEIKNVWIKEQYLNKT